MDLETEAKPRFLNHEEPRARLLIDLEDGSFVDVVRLIATYLYTGPCRFQLWV